jgi:hypothetical protein
MFADHDIVICSPVRKRERHRETKAGSARFDTLTDRL